ncbi:MAG: 16S rRNA (cytidine(1402)-2'-O)-methyltransferase [Bacteroidales bacterium]|nr:16S rRNA (cytidine(1402)-2'-O)-methyltransferase [Candidatus Colicola faecequi]
MLYLVPTPVGNLEDMTFRAIRVLKEVDLVLAEDTRTSAVLLQHFDIHTPLKSHHKFNEHETSADIVNRLLAGANIALISDAGTPAISDPGFFLVRAAAEAGVEIQCLPGATAFVPALVDSGLPNNHFYFEGFLPQKKGRATRLQYLSKLDQTFIVYESPFRLVKTLEQLAEVCGSSRHASVTREISKVHEDTQRGTLAELIGHFTEVPPKGEIVICIEGNNAGEDSECEEQEHTDLQPVAANEQPRKKSKYQLKMERLERGED